jgi:hypothetical protein
MLEMFKGKPTEKGNAKSQTAKAEDAAAAAPASPSEPTGGAA